MARWKRIGAREMQEKRLKVPAGKMDPRSRRKHMKARQNTMKDITLPPNSVEEYTDVQIAQDPIRLC